MLAAYRATGADPPFGDPRGYHGVGLEGHFWRITQPRTGAVVIVILAICRDARGPSVGHGLAGGPPRRGGARRRRCPTAWGAPRGLALRAGDAFAADERSLRVDLGPDARLEADASPSRWRGRGGRSARSGPAQVVPGLSQYWHPWLLRAQVSGSARVGAETIDLDGAVAYAEKNWGAGGMPPAWWWGQAHGFDRPDVCVAFAGGRAGLGPLRTTATALVVAVGDEVRTVVRPLRPLRVAVDERGWRLAGGGIEVEAHADGAPRTSCRYRSRSSAGAWTTGRPSTSPARCALSVRRRGRTLYEGTSRLAGLERGRGHLG